ncbi:MAG: peptidoglycan DD-metalloendopeptidase family protein [Bacteroidales bacterium]|nr:peptidoglycan DD-metalloendopeptidase family protein [Bacteroidales bacterium]
MKRVLFLLSLFFTVSCACDKPRDLKAEQENSEEVVTEFGIPTSEFDIKEGNVRSGQFFSMLMTDLGATNTDAYALTEACDGVFDLKKLKVGNSFRAFYTRDETPKLAYLVYQESRTSYVVFGLHDSIFVKNFTEQTETRTRVAEVVIENSLWADVERAGLNYEIASRLENIYAWSVDFFGLQKGDSFRFLFDEVIVKDEVVSIGTVYAATFTSKGKVYDAYLFKEGDTISIQYFNSMGENLKKAFLKAPLSYTRVSSGFTYSRRHPVTRIVRPHTGVDYAAPKGTPVMSIGDGVVIQKGYAGGGGNTVKIKHNATFTTAYLHLSKYGAGVAKGSRVRQGQVIGYVGSTGLSTGPHLDFRVWKNGKPINPLSMESPPAKKVDQSNMEAFRANMTNMKHQIDSLVSVQYLDTLVNNLGKK